MKNTLLKTYGIIIIIILLLGCVIFYNRSENVYLKNKDVSEEISNENALNFIKDYDPERTYYYKKTEVSKHVKTKIPFYYKKQIIKIKNYGIYSKK